MTTTHHPANPITPAPKVHTYRLGLPLRQLIWDPLHAGGCAWAGPARARVA